MPVRTLQFDANSPYRRMIGVGGIGTGLFFALEGEHTLGRNESRPGRLLNIRDYCKLHIISHYLAVLLGADPDGSRCRVIPIGKVGHDEAGRRMVAEMAAVGIDTSQVAAVPDQPTLLSVCFQYPDGSGGNITTSDSAAAALSCADVDRSAKLLALESQPYIALAAPEAPLATRHHLLKLAGAHQAFRAASFTSAEMEAARAERMFAHIDLLAMNEDESSALVGGEFDLTHPQPFLDLCAKTLLSFQPHLRIIVSAGKKGAFAFSQGTWDYRPAFSVPVASTAGAGDALLAGTLAALAVGAPFINGASVRSASGDRPLESAFDFGMLLAAFTVTTPHTIHPDANLETLLSFARQMGVAFSGALPDRL